jgi:hypothetical protein
MPVQMIELEEVSMMDITDDALESQHSPSLGYTSEALYPLTSQCC